MSAAKHTPGIWCAIEWSCHAATTVVAGEGRERIVIAECSGHGRYTHESVDDARLISAAKEMLAALEAEEEWQGRDLAGQIDPEWDYETMVGAKRRAAIAKAIGIAA